MNKSIKNIGIDQIYPIYVGNDQLKKSHCILGISPFNSFFSEENITALLNWANIQFRSFQIFIPDQISYYKPQFGVLESNFRADILRGSIV